MKLKICIVTQDRNWIWRGAVVKMHIPCERIDSEITLIIFAQVIVQMSEKQMIWFSSEGARHDIYFFGCLRWSW